MKPDGALHNLIEGYHHTWQDSGKTGQRFLLAGFFYAIRVIAYSVAFPLFAKEKGFSSSQIGVLIAVGAFSLLLTGLPVTRYAVRGHTRQLLLAAPVLSVIGLAILITAPAGNFALFVIGAALANSVSTVFWVLGDAILAAVVASEKRASVYALKFAVVTVGFALGGGLGGWHNP